jgi:flagellar basal body rod protein FlgC
MDYLTTLLGLLPARDAELVKETFEERAAVREYDANMNRQEAERMAFYDTLDMYKI